MPRQEFEGRTPAEAAIKACEELGLTRSSIKFDVISDSGEGIERRVQIRVNLEASGPGSAPSEAPRDDFRRDDRPPPRDDFRRDDRPPPRDDRPRGDRGGDRGGGGRDRGERFGRGRDRGDRGGRGGRGGRDRDRGPRREPVPREADDGIEALLKLDQTVGAARPAVSGTVSPKAGEAQGVLNQILTHMGWQATCNIVQDDPQEIHLDVVGNDAKRVVARKGEPLLSMQFLVNRMVAKKGQGEEAEQDQVVVLDVGGYRERRRAALAELAKRLAARAKEERKVVKLSPMSAHDRRVFHLTLTQIEGVTTRSEGDGLFRRLLIIPSELNAQ